MGHPESELIAGQAPVPHTLLKDGTESPEGIPVAFLLCPILLLSELPGNLQPSPAEGLRQIGSLSSEGRSTATTVLSLAAIRHLKSVEGIEPKAQSSLVSRITRRMPLSRQGISMISLRPDCFELPSTRPFIKPVQLGSPTTSSATRCLRS